MKRDLDALVDRGCWISDDRVYAFVSATGGIGELGYHGMQPVSRNSRILASPEGAALLSYRLAGGREQPFAFRRVEWTPGLVSATFDLPGGPIRITVRTSGRQAVLTWEGNPPEPESVLVRIPKSGLFANVQGTREWEAPRVVGNSLCLRCRDTIRLRSWLARTGAYAGDFLIPEVWRRRIFSRRVRSGMATRDDIRPEFRDADPLLYDATISLAIGGEGFSFTDEPEAWVFEHRFHGGSGPGANFVITCGESCEGANRVEIPGSHATGAAPRQRPPNLSLPGYPGWESFFESVPGLTDSCIVRDLGVPRACPGRYYWLWAWDMLVTAPEGARWGDQDLGRAIARFVDTHRDEDGGIPARWTRSLLPLDTPSPGGIEFLYGALVYENFLETGDRRELIDATRALRQQFSRAAVEIRTSGLHRGEGFYPDLLSEFGRTSQSAVCMEVGSWYVLCRIMENIAVVTGDDGTRQLAEECATAIGTGFLENFWDDRAGFLLDSALRPPGGPGAPHPLFALLFLYSPLGFSLLRAHVDVAARFVSSRLLSEHGIRSVPLSESVAGGEPITDAWYPHWDLYALKLLRRAGDADGIMRWLRRCEETLTRLGYCPEFLALRGFREGKKDAWLSHGSASNLNGVTAWYRIMRESICGVESDPGGLTHLPLRLPIDRVTIRDVGWRKGEWTIDVSYGGPQILRMEADGEAIEGCLKVPVRFAVPGRHLLVIHYGDIPPEAHFGELLNAEVIATAMKGGRPEVEVNGLGHVDGTFFSPAPAGVTLDGKAIRSSWERASGKGSFALPIHGRHILRLFAA